MSKFLLRDGALVSPTLCVVCQTSESAMFDTQTDIFNYGRVNVCVGCIREAANQLGYLEPADADVLRKELIEARAEFNRLSGQAGALLKAYAAFKEFEEVEEDYADELGEAITPTKRKKAKAA